MALTGKVVIITGASSGIGRATALKAASSGAHLALGDINTNGLQDVLEECNAVKAADASHQIFAFDVSDSTQCNQSIEAVVAHFGKIDHLFNCAGINPTSIATEDVSDETWDKLINTNLRGVFSMTRGCLPHMKSGSSIVNVSSVCGNYPVAHFAVYCAAKYGVVGFSKSVALEVGSKGVRVNIVAPGAIETPTNSAVRGGAAALKHAADESGLKRIGRPDEVANVVLFLFSDQSSYMNGAVLDIDGGLGIWS
ncbi:hypothetical protein N7478_010394 [Penicillium angulare]|uniref:uncharacterized protein n=1 Tax=Penicillium angulare TaxID=116970 RepID=UPI00253FD54E|nr:uncharacterized protein N7478_010394 [Penicillium angulare]KAJ5267586.1 hypothetical protein N7478_010394 [Penicillium angulare]